MKNRKIMNTDTKLTPEVEADRILNEFYANNQPFTIEIELSKKNAIFFVNKILNFLTDRAGCKDENPNVIHYKKVKEELEKR
jgi:dihydroneopterin aldolase